MEKPDFRGAWNASSPGRKRRSYPGKNKHGESAACLVCFVSPVIYRCSVKEQNIQFYRESRWWILQNNVLLGASDETEIRYLGSDWCIVRTHSHESTDAPQVSVITSLSGFRARLRAIGLWLPLFGSTTPNSQVWLHHPGYTMSALLALSNFYSGLMEITN